MKKDEQVMKALEELDIREKHFDMYVDLLFDPQKDNKDFMISYEELLDSICRMRPGSMVSALDFASFKEVVRHTQTTAQERVDRLCRLCDSLSGEVHQLLQKQQ